MFFIHNVLNKLRQDQFQILPVHKHKAWNSYSHLFLSLRFRNDPAYKNKQLTSTPNMYNPPSYDEHTKASKYILMDVYCNSCFGYAKFSGFQTTKTSANKRLKLCLQRSYAGRSARCCQTTTPTPAIPNISFAVAKLQQFF